MNPSPSSPKANAPVSRGRSEPSVVARRHLLFGWWALLLFLTLGIVLEALHGFKVGAYLNTNNTTRRLMWTLAHAHGTLLALVQLAFAFTVLAVPDWPARSRRVASTCLVAAGWLMPLGFFLGGLFIYGGDPGLGILLVPIGGIFLFAAVLSAALAIRHFDPNPRPPPGKR